MSKSRLVQNDVLLLKLVGEESIPKVAKDLGTSEVSIYNRFFRIRRRLDRYQDYCNNIRTLQKHNARIKAFTTKRSLKEEDEEEELTDLSKPRKIRGLLGNVS